MANIIQDNTTFNVSSVPQDLQSCGIEHQDL